MDCKDTVIFACSSLKDYVSAAQETEGTRFPVIFLDKEHHIEPKRMKQRILDAEKELPQTVENVLVAMGFCGGSLDSVSFSRRFVIPRVDDCVSLMLQTNQEYNPNPKETGHLYMMEQSPEDFSFERMMQDNPVEYEGISQETLFHMYFDSYTNLDIVDTGLNDCYSEAYAQKAQENADRIHAVLDYVQGSNQMLEKLVGGRWDKQFLVADPGHLIRHGDFFE
ncbi:MAG: DUF1638 domain-containing protein [Lachnospiraceae bacterium]|nr:DUF1638 domain-containing protein [Lachnospiraceae bacterium]